LVATALIVPALAPLSRVTWLLGIAETGPLGEPVLRQPVSVPIALAVVVLAYLVVRRVSADVAIRRTAG
jgi:hypothetical protein